MSDTAASMDEPPHSIGPARAEIEYPTDPNKKTLVGIPWWAGIHLKRLMDNVDETMSLLEMSIIGIGQVRLSAKNVQVLIDTHTSRSRDSLEELRARLPRAEELSRRAQAEIDRGFPLLHAQAVVALWTALESVIDDLLEAWLANVPSAWTIPALQRLNVRLGVYESLEQRERIRYALQRLKAERFDTEEGGVGPFEALLEAFGLGGGLDDDLRRDLHELQQVRNLVAHRRGIVDGRFASQLSYLSVVVGEVHVVTSEAAHRYAHAISPVLARAHVSAS